MPGFSRKKWGRWFSCFVCRQYYIHPAVMGALDTDGLEKAFGWVDRHRAGVRVQALGRAERAVLRFLTTREKR